MTFRRSLLALLVATSSVFAAVDVMGTVTDATSDVPLPKVRIFGPDSSFLESSDAQGRFLLRLPRPQEVLFRKEGFRDRVVALSELSNLLDVQVDLEPLGTRLETGVVTGQGGRRRLQAGSIAAIEEISGMRFDLQEHLRTLPGVAGTREFSSELSIFGSRTADVTHVFGPFAIPNLRHLDQSFPGNQSVLNPRVLQSVTVEHDPVNGPLEQGLASALRYQPRRASPDKYELTGSIGLTNREIDLFGPVGDGGVVLSARWLDPSILRHLGDRFFAGSSGTSAADRTGNEGPVSKFDLTAMDGFARVEQGIGSFALSVTTLAAFDEYDVKLKTSSLAPGGGLRTESFVPITQGDRGDWVAFTDLQGDLESGFLQAYAGIITRSEAQLLSDTTLFAVPDDVDNANRTQNPEDWAAWTKSSQDLRAGGMFRLGTPVLGAEAELLGAVDLIEEEWAQGRSFRRSVGFGIDDDRVSLSDLDGNGIPSAIQRTTSWTRSRSSARLRWTIDEARYGLAAGGLWVDGPGWNTELTASAMRPAFGIGWVGNASLRAQEGSRTTAPGRMEVVTTTGTELKIGGGKRVGFVDLTATVYGRDLSDPALPAPEFWWAFPISNQAEGAQVIGGTLQARVDAYKRIKALVNLSRVQGEYAMENGSVLEWEANRDLDILTEFKIHPMEDTLFSVILTHFASLGKPQYVYRLDTLNRSVEISGDETVDGGSPKRDAFRTDLRLELDMPVKVSPMQGMRFYLELQNVFSGFDASWAKILGGDNFRSRSLQPISVPSDVDPHPNRVTNIQKVVGARPTYARGTELFFTFGVEGSLGI